MPEAVRNAMGLAGVVLAFSALISVPRVQRWAPVLVALAVGAALLLGAVDGRWIGDSLRHDLAWRPVALLALWTAQARLGWARARGWLPVVLLTLVAGDLLVALGLAVAEPDDRRRARLVLAASGASLIGVWSGASSLVFGWGGPALTGLGLGLSLVGVGAGRGAVASAPMQPARAVEGLGLALAAGVFAWVLTLGGTLDFVAQGLERAPLELPRTWGVLTVLAAATLGALGDEATMAVALHEAAAHGLSIREAMVPAWMTAGLAVGNGLVLLLVTRSSLAVGFPLWLLQLAGVAAWAYWS